MSTTPRKRLAAVPTVPTVPDGQGRAPARRTSTPTTAAAAGGGAHGPYSRPPRSRALLPSERAPMVAQALRGVRLGAYDRRTVDWLCRQLDTPTFLALLGILQRTRQAATDRAGRPQREGSQQ